MANVSLRDLLEAGVHFGHQTRLWNPKMKPYIYGEKNGVHIIDLQKTAQSLLAGTRHITSEVSRGRTILFVGTKRAAREVIQEEAQRCGMFYVNNRWLGGTLTNFQTVKKSIDRLVALEKARDEGRFELLTKKEALDLTRKIAKMDRSLGGIKEMRSLPGLMFVIDPKREHIAIREAQRLGIQVVALCDTNCDPDGISHVIPGNDDALKSIRLFTGAIADAAIDGAHAGRDARGAGVVTAQAKDIDEVEVVRRGTADAEAEPEAAAPEAAAPEAAAPEAAAPEAAAPEAAAPVED